eukprot:snap_masked-scaffold_59-processed-gene-0.37-mRNA-1 protein AED:1.00 eAED:1.00 QI:0/-1/0/0/-1/1/1/0/67
MKRHREKVYLSDETKMSEEEKELNKKLTNKVLQDPVMREMISQKLHTIKKKDAGKSSSLRVRKDFYY